MDDEFLQFLERKIDMSQDLDERAALSSLRSTITHVRERIQEATNEGALEERSEELTMDQVKQRMRELQAGKSDGESKVTPGTPKFKDFSVKQDIRDTFLSIVDRFINPPSVSMTLEDVAEANYDLCDMKFMEMLQNEADQCLKEGASIEAEQYLDIIKAVKNVMVRRIGSAQERLQNVLSKGRVEAMEAEIIRMCRKAEVDEALILLLEANIKQAEDAGALKPAEVLRKLRQRITTETERKLPDEQRLLRVLLREARSEKRKELLYEAFKPAKSMNSEGSFVSGPPVISPPVFINIVRQLITGFGNVDGFNILGRAQSIIDEAQVVATDLYGEGMSPREQQKYMFEKQTVSVWDLASYEEEAIMRGEEIPWRNDSYDGKMPDEVLGERVRRVGGSGGDIPPF